MNFKNFGNDPPGFGLARQSSVYSLTFDEFQSTRGGSIGKDFGSMNMDELLKNIWSAEETQQVMGSTSGVVQEGNGAPNNYLQRLGSLTLPRTISQKTVDEVWKGLSNDHLLGSNLPARQQSLGEVTLEEFLFRAGIVREEARQPEKTQDLDLLGDLTRPVTNQPLGFGFQQMGNTNNQSPLQTNSFSTQQQPQIFPKQQNMGYSNPIQMANNARIGNPGTRNGIMGLSDTGLNGNLVQNGGFGTINMGANNGITVAIGSPSASSDGYGKTNGDTSSVSPVPYAFTGGLRGRRSNNAVEKVIERRQRRMIKNRESAARSRARKQAYTMELEAEIAKLKEENQELLKKQAEIMEMQKNQAVETMNKHQGGKRRHLKRTQTGPCRVIIYHSLGRRKIWE